MHPLIYEAHIKIGVPSMAGGLYGMTLSPNPNNIPFILYFAKNTNVGALSYLVTATEGYPNEREWLRPLALQMYKEHRDQGNVMGADGIVGMFSRFGTPEDLEILKQLRDYERELMPRQGIRLGDRQETGAAYRDAEKAYKASKSALEQAEREGAAEARRLDLQRELDEAESVLRERSLQWHGLLLKEQLNEYIQILEAQLQQKDENDVDS